MLRTLLVIFLTITWSLCDQCAGYHKFDHLRYHAEPHKHYHNMSREDNYNGTYFTSYYEYRGRAYEREFEDDSKRNAYIVREFRKHSKCPAMQLGASCASHNPLRNFMLLLEASHLDVKNSKSKSNVSIDINHDDPLLLLERLRGKRILFFGDSSMVQVNSEYYGPYFYPSISLYLPLSPSSPSLCGSFVAICRICV